MGINQIDKIGLEVYLAVEREGDTRYEYHEGELFAMAGGRRQMDR